MRLSRNPHVVLIVISAAAEERRRGVRLLRGERVWRAHRSHYYQRLVQLGWGHRNTALAEYALMAGCGGLALWALGQRSAVQWVAIGAAVVAYLVLAALVDLAWRRHALSGNAGAN